MLQIPSTIYYRQYTLYGIPFQYSRVYGCFAYARTKKTVILNLAVFTKALKGTGYDEEGIWA